MIEWLSNKVKKWAQPADDRSFALYEKIVAASRSADYFKRFDIEDSFDGRFDALTLLVVLVIRRLRADQTDGADRAQGVVDTMFADMDLSLHEVGVSENKVGNKVKTMAKAFLGRMKAYSDALDADDRAAFADALARNLYRDNGIDPVTNGLVDAVFAAADELAAMDITDLEDQGLARGLAALTGQGA